MIYDISQPLFNCQVYPGDPKPQCQTVCSIAAGDVCNLTAFSACAHNGTHVDAPRHFYDGGKGIGDIALEKFVGEAFVVSHSGDVTAPDAEALLKKAKAACDGSQKKILFKGNAVLTAEAAQVFAQAKIDLVGVESQTVGPEDAPMQVHLILLDAEVVLLEGLRLGEVSDGFYTLNCAPINLGNADGAPCRAILINNKT